MIEIMTQSKL